MEKKTQYQIDTENGNKVCNTCNLSLLLQNFRIKLNRNKKPNFYPVCKSCEYAKHKKYIKANPDKLKETRRRYRSKNRDIINLKQLEKGREYRKNHPEKTRESVRRSYYKHREKRLAQIYEYKKEKRKREPGLRIRENLNRRISYAVKNNKTIKSASTMELIGCSMDKFKEYIESLFSEGMNWDNYGNKENHWSLDHLLPCELFDLVDENQQKICFHYTNMAPVWHIKNIQKSDILPEINKQARLLTKEEKIEYLKSKGIFF